MRRKTQHFLHLDALHMNIDMLMPFGGRARPHNNILLGDGECNVAEQE